MSVALKHLVPILLATALGSVAYIFALRAIWNQEIDGEVAAVVFAGFGSLLVAYPLVYLPTLRLLKHKLRGVRPYFLFPLCAVVLGVVPVALLNLCWNFGLRAMLSPESQLFYIYFAVVGVVIGGLYPFISPGVGSPRR